jgi:uncharacterized protein YkwD
MRFPTYATLLTLGSGLALAAVPPSQTDTTFINTVLTRVNGYRAQHAAKALTWDATLANTARSAATTCNGQHIVTDTLILPFYH